MHVANATCSGRVDRIELRVKDLGFGPSTALRPWEDDFSSYGIHFPSRKCVRIKRSLEGPHEGLKSHGDTVEHGLDDSSNEANLSCLGFHRKDQYLLSPVNCWYLVLHQTRRESRDHATLNDIFMNNVIVRLSQISEDVIRLFKKVGKRAT